MSMWHYHCNIQVKISRTRSSPTVMNTWWTGGNGAAWSLFLPHTLLWLSGEGGGQSLLYQSQYTIKATLTMEKHTMLLSWYSKVLSPQIVPPQLGWYYAKTVRAASGARTRIGLRRQPILVLCNLCHGAVAVNGITNFSKLLFLLVSFFIF
jgi:hypothetical protein